MNATRVSEHASRQNVQMTALLMLKLKAVWLLKTGTCCRNEYYVGIQ